MDHADRQRAPESPPGGARDFNGKVIEEFRANGGRVGGMFSSTPLILIHHRGAASGVERVTPLVCTPQGDGRYVIVASNGGSPTHPSWYYDLKADPRIEVEVGVETFFVRAEEVAGAERAEHWARLTAESSSLREFETKVSRLIPVFVLTREPEIHHENMGA